MTIKEFIENYIRVASKGEHLKLKLTSAQYAFLDWLEDCKKKGLNVIRLKGRDGRI